MEGLFRRRRLPHWDLPDAAYFVTFCLAGSIPASGLQELNGYRKELDLRKPPPNVSPQEWEYQKQKMLFARLDELLDSRPAVRHFERVDLAEIVLKSLLYFEGHHYDTLAFVVMPSHCHWVLKPRTAWWQIQQATSAYESPREHILQAMKSYSAHACNKLLGLHGAFWQDESYDHVVRDDAELERIIAYVINNPVKAGLVRSPSEFRWSSAYRLT